MVESNQSSSSSSICQTLPDILSSFIDTFVDFSVSGGLFLPQSQHSNPNPNPNPTAISPHPRLIAIGDLHGDLPKSLQTLSLSSLIDQSLLRWSPPSPTTALLVGDLLDRGSQEIPLLYLLHRLKLQSHHHLVTLLGNHEIMNIESDFRYVTQESLHDFLNWSFWYRQGISMKRCSPSFIPTPPNPFKGVPSSFPGVKPEFWPGFRARIAALRPGGPISARFLADNPVVVVAFDSVFVHGGLLEEHVEYGLERINREVREWVLGGKGRLSPGYMRGRDSVVWLRRFSEGVNCDCERLGRVLGMIPGARRMVMGHTIQEEGINGVCEDRAIRIDVGISRGCGNGLPEVLEIRDGGKDVRILTSNAVYAKRREEVKEGVGLLEKEGGRMMEVEAKA